MLMGYIYAVTCISDIIHGQTCSAGVTVYIYVPHGWLMSMATHAGMHTMYSKKRFCRSVSECYGYVVQVLLG